MKLKTICIGLVSALLVLLGAFFESHLDVTMLFTGISALATAAAACAAMYSSQVTERSLLVWKSQMKTEIELTEAKEVKVALEAWYRHFLSESNSKIHMPFEHIDLEIGLWYREPSSNVAHLENYVNELTSLWDDFEKALDVTDVVALKQYHRTSLLKIHREHVKCCRKLIYILNNTGFKEAFIDPYVISAIYNCKDWDDLSLRQGEFIYRIEAETFTQDGVSKKYKKDDGTSIYTNPFQEVEGLRRNIGIQLDEKIAEIRESLGTL